MILGMFLFLILIIEAGFRNNLKNVGKFVTKPFNRRGPMPRIHLKYIDDMTVAESLNLKKVLIENPDNNPSRPIQYHKRTGHILPEGLSAVQNLLKEIQIYSENHEMKINDSKTKVILFNKSRKYDFLPDCHFVEGQMLQVVEEVKLLGVMIRSDLSWSSHCQQICQKGFSRLWMLKRLKPYGATTQELMEIYRTQIRCVLEFGVAAWNSGLTCDQVNKIERVQKSAFAVILGLNYQNYENALRVLEMETLSTRRQELCLKFAKKSFKNEKFNSWFCPDDGKSITRSTVPSLKPVQARKRKFEKSPLYYLTSLLNMNPM